jgi:FkbM family methyltransferase
MAYLREWVRPGSVAVDVGANIGIFSYALCRLGAEVEAFEPLPECAATIRTYRSRHLKLHNVALSSELGELELHVPVSDGMPNFGRASLSNQFGEDDIVLKVPVKPLDEFGLENVSFIKIDCEGHESRVLAGAVDTVKRNRPVMLVEIEQRHLSVPMNEVFDAFLASDYHGYFHRNGRFFPLSEFKYERDQEPYQANPDGNREYINNFVFKP